MQKSLSSYEDTLKQQAEEKKEPAKSLDPRQRGQPHHSAVHSAIETVTPTVDVAATADTVIDSSTGSATP